MAWDEWETLKSQATGGPGGMQLTQVAPDAGGNGGAPRGVLKASQKDLAAVGTAAGTLHDDFKQYSDLARVTSQAAAGGLKKEGLAIGGGLEHVATRWVEQCRSLLDASAHIANHLRRTQSVHDEDDAKVRAAVSSIATLDKGFDENPANSAKGR